MGYRKFILLSFVCFSITHLSAGDLNSWLVEQSGFAFDRLKQNISPAGTSKGVVVASPSKKDPDYFYHWVRDAAITMEVVCTRYLRATSSSEKNQLERMLFDFADFSLKNQSVTTPSGGPGEPKFHTDGSSFVGPWGRPQDDGPALRALLFTRFAKILLMEGREDVVRRRLYQAKSDSLIKFDLEYVAQNWKETSFDLWEEVKGHHFFTAMVQRRALSEGAWLAEKLGDHGAAEWYRKQATQMGTLMTRFWNVGKRQIDATINWDGGVNYKTSGLDSAVVLGVLHGDLGDGLFGVGDDRVMATVNKLESVFEVIYPVNKNGQPGIAIGRYPEDRYDGYATHGEGNPWVINTAALAEFYHRLATHYLHTQHISVTEINRPFFQSLGLTDLQAEIGATRDQKTFKEVISSLTEKADQFLSRVKYHAADGGVLSEQINRHSGYMQGALDLTWSYGALLSAMDHRTRLKN